ncbi:hypothetical protein I547_3975 [Mycobacterium kansasii 824]|nr:hypothetical protein I547_3975 [Mycobacterium kansasii 824]
MRRTRMTPSAKDANVKIAVASINHRLARGGGLAATQTMQGPARLVR